MLIIFRLTQRIFILNIFSICIALLFFSYISNANSFIKAIDGDSLRVYEKNNKKILRLYGIDTPELSQSFGEVAKDHLTYLIENNDIVIESMGQDFYGRILVILYVSDGSTVQDRLLSQGLAWVYPQYCRARICKQWFEIEERARKDKHGLWIEENAIQPWKWRKKKIKQ